MQIPSIDFDPKYALTANEMREVDRVAVEEFHLKIIQMMELAAFNMAKLIRIRLGDLLGKKILIVAGKGNNGGDGIVSARFLSNWGAKVTVIHPKEVNDNARHHLDFIKKLKITITNSFEIDKSTDAIVDGILGYSIKGNVKEPFKTWMEEINGKVLPVFSFDIPSGLDPNDGKAHGVAVKADSTLTLAYPKKGLFVEKAKKYVGELYLADIGIPPAVYEKVKKKYSKVVYNNPFLTGSLVKIA